MCAEYHDLGICSDCLLYLANGDLPEDNSDGWTPENIKTHWPNHKITLGHVHDCSHNEECEGCNDDPWFSWQPCDACGSRLGGDRYKATAFERD